MHFVQKLRNQLDLIYHDWPGYIREALSQKRRSRGVFGEYVRLQQIDQAGIGIVLAYPVAFPRLARPPQKG
jgi:hypothetical protein